MFPNLATLTPSTSLRAAMQGFMRQSPGFAVVLDTMTLVGVITEYDLLRWMVQGRDLDRTHLDSLPLSLPETVQENTRCQDLLHLYIQRRIRRFPVVNEDQMLSGGIMERQLLAAFPRSNLLSHYRVRDILVANAPLIELPAPYMDVARRMVTWHQGCVLVHEGMQLRGIVTERDMLRCRLRTDWHPEMSIAEILTVNPVVIRVEDDLLSAVDQMERSGHRRFPAVDAAGQLVGLVTQTGVLNQMAVAVRSRQAVLNPENIPDPAIWFAPYDSHPVLAMNHRCAELLRLDMATTIGTSMDGFVTDPALWNALVVLLQHCGQVGPLQLSLRTGDGEWACVGCKFLLVHTPTGDDRVFCTIQEPVRSTSDDPCA
jgi:large subunit ribosomal protein L28